MLCLPPGWRAFPEITVCRSLFVCYHYITVIINIIIVVIIGLLWPIHGEEKCAGKYAQVQVHGGGGGGVFINAFI